MTTPDPALLRDEGIAADLSQALAGGQSLDHASLTSILQGAATDGITAAEMQSLQQMAAWIDGGTLSTSAYDAYIFGALVEGDPANATWTGGASTPTSLGNLAIGSSQIQADRLIGKWFLGTDLPGVPVTRHPAAYSRSPIPLFGSHSAPNYRDVSQGELGDCYFMSSLATIALIDPGVIQSMITDNRDGTYGVRFLDPNDLSARYVTVNSQFPTYDNHRWRDGSDLAFAYGHQKWAPLLEKAYAQVNAEGILPRTAGNNYGLIQSGLGDPITEITGKRVIRSDVTQAAIFNAWNANQEILVGTKDTASGNFVPKHMFHVINYDMKTGQVQLRNPWGESSGAPYEMKFWTSIEDLQPNATYLYIAQGATQASLTTATSTGFMGNLTDMRFDFDGGHDLMTRPNGATVDLSAMRLINFIDGTVAKFSGSPLVNDLYYYATNLDVWSARIDAATHYDQSGWKEGRNPNALFSTTGYLAANQDVKQAGYSPLAHYDTNGWKEGRDPSALFDNEQYLARNLDVKAAGLDPLLHYLQFGQAEGRATYAAIGRSSDFTHGSFDAEYYLLANADVAAAALITGGDGFAFAYDHYRSTGWREGRKADAYYDPAYYLAQNPDVALAGIDPLAHYDQYGWKEGRNPSAGFNTNAYLARNPDVAAAQIDPLTHYLQFGAVEGRSFA